jgi:hypothetical protein
MIAGAQQKVLLTQDENGNLKMEDSMKELLFGKNNYKLVRQRDGLTKESNDVLWVEFNEDGTFKEKHDKPSVGRSLLMSPFNTSFTWLTTPITKILEMSENLIKFDTENSTYELYKIEE